jgi:hypothetical protein
MNTHSIKTHSWLSFSNAQSPLEIMSENSGVVGVKKIAGFLLLLASSLVSVSPAHAIPAFARKYGLPCSACHEAWPMLNNFGQTFKDNGYQLGNGRDAPIYQQPEYWPITFRLTPQWHRESNGRVAVDQTPGNGSSGQVEASVTKSGFDTSSIDLLAAGTLSNNISFLCSHSSEMAVRFWPRPGCASTTWRKRAGSI